MLEGVCYFHHRDAPIAAGDIETIFQACNGGVDAPDFLALEALVLIVGLARPGVDAGQLGFATTEVEQLARCQGAGVDPIQCVPRIIPIIAAIAHPVQSQPLTPIAWIRSVP